MELNGKKIALLIEDMYNEYEVIYPYYRLQEAGAEVVVVGSGAKEVHQSKMGLTVSVDAVAYDVGPDDFDGVVIPGGYAPDMMRRYPAMVGLVKGLFDQGKVVAAICHAGWMLASADIVRGKRLTSFFAIKDDLIHAGADWVDAEVVAEGNLITSRKPDDLPAFMREVIKALAA